MKYLILITFALIGLVSSTLAQYTSAKDSDPEAIKLLAASGKNMAGSNTQVNFTYKLSYPGEEGKTMTGILYQTGDSYHLDLESYSIISNGKTRWVYLKDANEINIYNESNGQDWISPSDFLQLHKAQDLVFVLAGKRADGTAIIEAKPLKGRFDDFSKFTINFKGENLSSIKALTKDGTRQEMTIGTITHPATLDAAKLFTFNPKAFPGVHVEDLRLD